MFFTLLFVGLGLVSQVTAADPNAKASGEVTRLVRLLDDRDRQVRVEAEKKLVELGPSILPILPAIDASTPAEMKDRLARVRTTLEGQLARQAAEGSRISLTGSKSLAEIVAAIKDQTGNQLVDFREQFGQQDENLRFDVNFQDTPFWSALDSLLDQFGLTVYNYG